MEKINRTRIFLIILLILCTLGAIGAIFVRTSIDQQPIQLTELVAWLCLLILNTICAHYLYKKAANNKIEWALFGFIGNLNAILFYYCKDYLTSRWKNGKSIFRD